MITSPSLIPAGELHAKINVLWRKLSALRTDLEADGKPEQADVAFRLGELARQKSRQLFEDFVQADDATFAAAGTALDVATAEAQAAANDISRTAAAFETTANALKIIDDLIVTAALLMP